MKTNKLMTRLLSGALIALGFTSCEEMEDEYGSPSRDFQVKGVVTDENGKPIENIRVIIRNAYEYGYSPDTTYTDAQGNFSSNVIRDYGFINEQTAYFDDIDGDANGGTFQSDSTSLNDMPSKQTEKGDGWYEGKYEFEVQQKLKKEKNH